jgi:hypothetical protein
LSGAALRWSGKQQIIAARPRHSKKNHEEPS